MLKIKVNAGSYAKNQSTSEADDLLRLIDQLAILDADIEIIDFELFVVPTDGWPWRKDYQLELLERMGNDYVIYPGVKRKAHFFIKLDLKKLADNNGVYEGDLAKSIVESGVDVELINPLENRYIVPEDGQEQFRVQHFLESCINVTVSKESL